MAWAFLFTAAVTALVVASPLASAAAPQLNVKMVVPSKHRNPSPDVQSSHVLSLQRHPHPSKSSGYLKALSHGLDATNRFSLVPHQGQTHMNNLFSAEYITTISWNGERVKVIVDTGSSDTWLVQSAFQCLDENGVEVQETQCSFGPTFNGTFQGGVIPDEHFNISYTDNEFLFGRFGYEDIRVAGITAKNQQVALVDRAYWTGDNVTSGLLGLAYPYLTRAFPGTDPSKDNRTERILYDSIFTTMIKESRIAPVFSLACQRNSSGGYLALGGLPPVHVASPFVSTPIRKLEVYNSSEPGMLTQFSFYTIVADAYIYHGSHKSASGSGDGWWNSMVNWPGISDDKFPVIVDSGTTLLSLPSKIASDIAALFNPPAIYFPHQGAYFAPCSASVPGLGVVIGGHLFRISATDLLLQSQTISYNSTTLCLVGVSNGGEGPYILGDTFLNNVVAVFDVGASEMRFAAHEY